MFGFLKREKKLIHLIYPHENNEKALNNLRYGSSYVTLRPLPIFVQKGDNKLEEEYLEPFSVVRPRTIADDSYSEFDYVEISNSKYFTRQEYYWESLLDKGRSGIIEDELLLKYSIPTYPIHIMLTDKSFEFDTCKHNLGFERVSDENLFFIMLAVFISCMTMFHYEASSAMSVGVFDVLKQALSQISDDSISLYSKRKLADKTTLYLKDVYKTLESMDALKEISYKNLIEIIDNQNKEAEREKQLLKSEKEKKEANVTSLIEQIEARRKLLNDFNRPLDEAIKLIKKEEGQLDVSESDT